MNHNGLLISFEGMDFSGKSTQIGLLTAKLDQAGIKNMTLREPGGTAIGEKIRDILLDRNANEMVSETELLLYSAARSQLVRELIIPRLEIGYWVILDRFFDSTLAYQGYGRGISLEKIEQITAFAVEKYIPDVTFYLRLSMAEMTKRKKNAGRTEDRLEANRDEFFENVLKGYEVIAKSDSKRVKGIDASQDIGGVFDAIWAELSAYLPK